MGLLFLYWAMLLMGYFIGTKCRSRKEKLSWVGTFLIAAIILLVFVMGVRMGSNREVVENLHTIGLDALFMTIMIMIGSVVAVMITRKLLRIDRYGRMKDAEANHQPETPGCDPSPELCRDEAPCEKDNSGRMITIAILVSVILGVFFGHLFIPGIFSDYSYFEAVSGNTLVIGLCILLFFVGTDMGLAGTIVSSLRKAGARVLAFPAAVVLGTLAAAFLCGLVLPISQKEALAIGAGFGWYTLAPIVITEQGYAISGAISFMHNIMRELGGIVLLPLVAQRIGHIEAASLPGVASMDICLPLVERACSEEIVVYSFLIGLLQSAAVPVLVPLIIS